MPVDKVQRGDLTDVISKIGAYVRDTVKGEPDSLFTVRELTKMLAAATNKPQDGYLVAIAIGLLCSVEEVVVEKRAGKLYVGSK